jgi:DNA repair exonuclease SbcCD ATPase subunit
MWLDSKGHKMKRPAQKAFVLAVGIVVITLIAGCDEEQNLSSTKSAVKKHQLIAAENMRLTKELERRDKEIKRQKELHNNKIEQQQELLEKCLQEKNAWKKSAQQNIQEQVDKVLAGVMEELVKLRDENNGLKAQIEQLKAELEEAKKFTAEITS